VAWSDIRAALILAVLVPNVIYALPVPPALTPERLSTPLRQRELQEWSATLTAVGLPISPEDLGDRMTRLTTTTASVHRALKAPFRPITRLTGTNQSWPLFGSATTHPTRLTVEVVRSGQRQVWFRRLDPEHPWLQERFRYRRLRGIYDLTPGARTSGTYRRFAQGVADWAFDAVPEVSEVHIYLEETPLAYPWEPPLPPGPALHAVTIRRPP